MGVLNILTMIDKKLRNSTFLKYLSINKITKRVQNVLKIISYYLLKTNMNKVLCIVTTLLVRYKNKYKIV